MLKKPPIGPFAAIYADVSTNSTALIQIPDLRYGTEPIEIAMPTIYIPNLDTEFQSDLISIQFSLNFYSDSELVFNLGKGQALNTDSNLAFIAATKYSMLLLGNDPDTDISYYIPAARPVKKLSLSYGKDNPTTLTLNFVVNTRDASTNPYFKDPYNTLVSEGDIPAGKVPF